MIKRKVSHWMEWLRPSGRRRGQRPLHEPWWLSGFIRTLACEVARQAARQLKDWFQV